MIYFKRVAGTLVLIAVAVVVLLLAATGFVEGFIWVSGQLGVHHALGTDTQSSENYASVSGVLPIVVTTLGFSGLLVTAWRRWNCHEPGCWRHGKYQLPSGVNACDLHNPDLDTRPEGERGLVHKLHTAHHARQAEHFAAAVTAKSKEAH